MRIPILTFGAFASVLTINSVFANTIVTSQTYVDNADAEIYDEIDALSEAKQDLIPVGDIPSNWGDDVNTTLVTYDIDNDEIVGNSYGILSPMNWGGEALFHYVDAHEGNTEHILNTVPETGLVADAFSYIYNEYLHNGSVPNEVGALAAYDRGGDLGDMRRIYDGSATYNSGTHSTYIPTMGAVMSAISNNTPTLPTGTANTVVMYNNSGAIGGSRAIYDGSATYNATNDATKLVTANGVSKMKECTRWADNAEHTDANCLLWRLP